MMSFSTRFVFSIVVLKEETPVFVICTPGVRDSRSAFPGLAAGKSRVRVVSAAPESSGA
jgi:hypothetical protein